MPSTPTVLSQQLLIAVDFDGFDSIITPSLFSKLMPSTIAGPEISSLSPEDESRGTLPRSGLMEVARIVTIAAASAEYAKSRYDPKRRAPATTHPTVATNVLQSALLRCSRATRRFP